METPPPPGDTYALVAARHLAARGFVGWGMRWTPAGHAARYEGGVLAAYREHWRGGPFFTGKDPDGNPGNWTMELSRHMTTLYEPLPVSDGVQITPVPQPVRRWERVTVEVYNPDAARAHAPGHAAAGAAGEVARATLYAYGETLAPDGTSLALENRALPEGASGQALERAYMDSQFCWGWLELCTGVQRPSPPGA
ncbi:MAG TPA: hypothetical protein VLF71_03985 [Candidatus Saccharimonadales bacterium]|nr:hypothetical protein [Candidatus Saccharimonadales bacterium]